MTNSADPVQTPQNAASDLGLHCLCNVWKFLQNIVIINTVRMCSRWRAIANPHARQVANVLHSMIDGWTDRRTNELILAHPYYEERSCSKFG